MNFQGCEGPTMSQVLAVDRQMGEAGMYFWSRGWYRLRSACTLGALTTCARQF